MRLKPTPSRRTEPDLTGLINIVFLILIFFIVAGSLRPYNASDLRLVKSDTGEAEAATGSHLIVKANGRILYRGIETPVTDLRQRLEGEPNVATGAQSLSPCVIVADARSDAQVVLDVAEICGATRHGRVILLTEKKPNRLSDSR